MRKWVTLFSQTGSEIYNLSNKLERNPNVIITNSERVRPEVIDKFGDSIVYVGSKPTIEDYLRFIPVNSLVTLHGWLRIVPEEICDRYEIYNLHPANLFHNPELKGKDPQKMAYNKKLTFSGNTIHRCTAELDAGEILEHSYTSIEGLSLCETINTLHDDASSLWYRFLKKHLQ
jgi:methionyl-tRNA formyltransferase